MNYREADAITDQRLLKQSLFVMALVITGFVMAHHINAEPSTIALFGAALLLILDNLSRSSEEQSEIVHNTFGRIEWTTIFFFMGLFVVVYGIETTGILEMLAQHVVSLTQGDRGVTAIAVLWTSAVASAIVDNIPFVATMIPLIESMAPDFGGSEQLMPVWWSLALGSCLGGNGSLVGASANLIVAGFAERSGQPIRFLPFMLMAFPLMLVSIAISTVYVYWRYF
jgi:Na+/H+ antiporter NhaD/arsenite permease-like protein